MKDFPQIAYWLIRQFTPVRFQNDILGDLLEEQKIRVDSGEHWLAIRFWLYQQVIASAVFHIAKGKCTFPLFVLTGAIFLFALLFNAVSYLSFADDINAYAKAFWLDGRAHLLLFEPSFWQLLPETFGTNFQIIHIIDSYSALWILTMLLLIYWLERKFNLSLVAYLALCALALLLPNLLIADYLYATQIPLNEIGPYIIRMWLPIMYGIFPLTIGFLTKRSELANQEYHATN